MNMSSFSKVFPNMLLSLRHTQHNADTVIKAHPPHRSGVVYIKVGGAVVYIAIFGIYTVDVQKLIYEGNDFPVIGTYTHTYIRTCTCTYIHKICSTAELLV